MNVRTQESGAGVGKERGGLGPPGWLSSCAPVPSQGSQLGQAHSHSPQGLALAHPPPAVLTALQEAVVFVNPSSPDTQGSELATKSSVSRTAPASEQALHKRWLNEWEEGVRGKERRGRGSISGIYCQPGGVYAPLSIVQSSLRPTLLPPPQTGPLASPSTCIAALPGPGGSVPGLFQAFL